MDSTENLFLLEFLVDNIKMDARCDCDTPPGEHCVSFQFLDNDPLEVCEADFEKRNFRDESNKNGKSCLFSLSPEQMDQATQVFDVVVTVFKKMQPGWLPERIAIGSAMISIANLFTELIRSVEMQTEKSPSAKTMKDCFVLQDGDGENVGKICVYIRMSCFGKLIVTQFQMNLEDQSVLFKDKGGQSLYHYKKAKKQRPPNEYVQPPQEPPYPPPNLNCPTTPCFPDGSPMDMGGMQNMFPPFPDMGGFAPPGSPQSGMFPGMAQSAMLPCSECNMMMGGMGGNGGGMGGMGCGMGGMGGGMGGMSGGFQPPCFSGNGQVLTPCEECGAMVASPQFQDEMYPGQGYPEPQPEPQGNYQEIGAVMGGNALTIRVHKDKNRVEQVDGDSVDGSGSCSCSPGNVGAKKPQEPTCPPPPCAPQSFDFRPGMQQGDQNLPFSFKMSGAGAGPNNNVIVSPPVCTKPDGTKYTEISDPNKETFVLRIGKKSEGAQKKQNLELELCTPRGPELKPIPKKETRDSQYDPADCPGGGGGKGKKGKGKKDKKGGKGKKGKKK